MGIYRYSVKLDTRDPMYGNTKILKECGEDKEGALAWADENGRHMGASRDLVYVEEAEYVSESNLQKGISSYRRPIWSAAFHGYSAGKKESVEEKIEAAKGKLEATISGGKIKDEKGKNDEKVR